MKSRESASILLWAIHRISVLEALQISDLGRLADQVHGRHVMHFRRPRTRFPHIENYIANMSVKTPGEHERHALPLAPKRRMEDEALDFDTALNPAKHYPRKRVAVAVSTIVLMSDLGLTNRIVRSLQTTKDKV